MRPPPPSTSSPLPEATQSPCGVNAEALYAEANTIDMEGTEGADRVLKLLLQACELGHSPSMYLTGMLLVTNPWEAPGNPALGRSWLKRAGAQGDAQLQLNLGDLYNEGYLSIKADPAKTMLHWLRAAEWGLPEAQCRVAEAYSNGQHVEPDQAKAAAWWEKAASAGHLPAIQVLAAVLEQGSPAVPQDEAKAATLYRLGALAGDGPCQSALGRMYLEGRGVPEDLGEAFGLFLKSANQGDGDSQFQVAWMYESGQGVPADPSRAFLWYLQCTLGGVAPASCNQLAQLVEHGLLVKATDGALMMFQTAAAWGDATAALELGDRYERGRGVQPDRAAAISNYQRAASLGSAEAAASLSRLGETLN